MGLIPALIFNKPDFGGALSLRVETLENNEQIYQLFGYVGTSTTGTVTIPTGATIFDVYNDGILDAILVEADINQKPTTKNSTNSNGEIVQVTSLNNNGDYVLDSIPTENSCLLFYIKIQALNISNIPLSSIVEAGIPLSQNSFGMITVGKSNADFNSVKDACDYAATKATVDKPYYIEVIGSFIENPFSIPAYTNVLLKSGTISASDNNNPLITLSGQFCELKGGNISGPSNSDAVLVTAGNTAVKDIVISNAGRCGVNVLNVVFPNRCLIRNTTIANCSKGVCIDNSFVVLTTSSSSLSSIASIEINNLSNAIIDSFVSVGSTLALSVLDPSTVRMNASQMSIDDVFIFDWDSVYLSFTSDKENDEAAIIAQELQIGVPEKGQEFSSGEGESYSRGMLVYTETELGVFNNVSSQAASASGSLFGFASNVAGNSIYIASSLNNSIDYVRHYGIKAVVNTEAVYGTGSIELEYWNGSAWTLVNGNDRDSEPPYFSRAKQYFTELGGSQLRYNISMSANNWAKNDPMTLGTSYYWVRFRITSDITIAPVFQQFKLHPNKIEFNADAFREYFGGGRSIAQLPVNIGQGKPISGNMQNQSLWIDQNVGVGFLTNKFTATGDILGWNFLLPFDADPSSPITFSWGGLPNQAAVIQWTVRVSHIEAGVGLVYTSNPPALSNVFTKTVVINPGVTVLNVNNTYSVELDVSEAIERRETKSGDLIFVTIQPTILSGNFSLISAGASYTKWSDGGHI